MPLLYLILGATRQTCGVLGKQDICQVGFSVSWTSVQGRLLVAWRLHLPHSLAKDLRRARALR